ncbi:MAG TPA: mycothiol synthase [Galbitalea sp.]|jgi:mycothiol synthase|nr:mycothiol synthase [Galbitalea sp.]
MSDSARSVPDWVNALASRARDADGVPPFSDQAFVDYRLGKRDLVAIEETAAALATETEAEFVVDPDARGGGLGTRMLDQLLERGVTLLWAHGDHPAARALAASHHLKAVRELLHLAGEVSICEASPRYSTNGPADGRAADDGSIIETFRPGADEDEWVAVNARIFAHHPEQGSVSRVDLEQLESEDWFRADSFLTLRRDGRMIGYCWLKVEQGRGEFYVVGISPDFQGEHLGAMLFDAGLARLATLGIRQAHLYVEADNEPALALYRARGFVQDGVDIQYALAFQEGV